MRKLSPMLQKAGASSHVWEQRGTKKIFAVETLTGFMLVYITTYADIKK
jgi:hypothetical protein